MLNRLFVSVLVVASLVGCATSSKSAKVAEAEPPPKVDDANAPLQVDVTPVANPGPRKRIGIMDFENASTTSWGSNRDALAVAARDAVSEALVKSGAFVVVEREQIAKVLGEQALGMSGAINSKSAAKAGELLGLQALVTGKITDFNISKNTSGYGGYFQSQTTKYHARVSLRVIDASTGELWSAESGEGTAEVESTTVMGGGSQNQDENSGKRALYRAIGQMIDKAVAKAVSRPWSGMVAKVGKGKVYVTAGSAVGLAAGTTLAVRRQGEEIADPTTGQIIGHEMGKVIGKLQVAEHVNEKLTVCVALSGAGFNTGDVVAVEATAAAAP